MPPGADRSRPLPLILAFHGASGDRGFAESAGLHRAADRRGFIVVSPHGVAGDWALGCGCTQPDRQGVDDVRFFDTLVAHVSSHVAVDPDRVYVTGFSNGATFSYRLACERAQAVAAAGIVAGSVFDAEACRPVRPMPVLAFHGSSDPVLGYLGGYFAAQAWARLDGCGTSPTATPLPDRADDDTRLWRYDFPGCAGGSQVVFYSIDGGGHTWPGAEYPASSPLQSREIEASEEIVDFFARHTRR
jgi:polyhydroxybutyrate depolymerase